MKTLAAVTLALSTALAGSAFGYRDTLKCAPNTPLLFPDAPENVYVLNGKVVSADGFKELELDPKSVESVEIVCATDLHRVFGHQARRSGVVVFTSPGPTTALRTSIQSIQKAQQDYAARHGVFAATLADLRWTDASGLITVKLTLSEGGSRWSATGSHRYHIGPSFAVSVSGEKAR